MKLFSHSTTVSRLMSRLTVVFLFTLTGNVYSQTHEIHGRITDFDTGAPVSDVNISAIDSKTGTATDQQGNFSLRLPAGTWRLLFSHIGYEVLKTTISMPVDATVAIRLRARPYQAPGVMVSASRPGEGTLLGPYHLDARSMANAPALGDPDPFRAVTLLPGVISANDLKGEIHIRGSASDQNLILLDGVEIQNPFHMLGLVGTFNVDALQSIQLYPGLLPVRFEDKLGGALVLRTRQAEKSLQTKIRLSLLASSLVTEKKWGTGQMMVSLRRTYFDIFMRLLSSTGFDYHFYDGHVHFTQKLAPDWQVKATGFLSKDHFNPFASDAYENSNGPTSVPAARDDWGNTTWALRLIYTGKSILWQNQVSIAQHFNQFDGPGNDVQINNRLRDVRLKSHLDWIGERSTLELGAFYRPLSFKYRWLGKKNQDTLEEIFYPGVPDSFQTDFAISVFGGYASLERKLFSGITAQFGARVTAANRGKMAVLPRAGLQIRFPQNLVWRLGYGEQAQWFAAGQESRETSVGSPLFPTPSLPLRLRQYSLGLETSGIFNTTVKAEAFYKQLLRVSRLTLTGQYPSFENGKGWVRGFDLFLVRDRGRLTYQAGYSWLQASLDFSGESYAPDWEIRHAFKGMLGLHIGRGWSVHSTLLAQTGAPFTPANWFVPFISIAQGGYKIDPFFWQAVSSAKNSARLPNYFRLDLLFRKQWQRSAKRYEVYLQIINLFFHNNTIRQTPDILRYTGETLQYEKQSGLPILPSLGFGMSF